jgi:hypothetical protein
MISLVLYGRNDSYGYNLHKRAAISLNCMAEVLTAPGDEILFVDYNTPDDFPTFPEAIQDTLTDRAKRLMRILRVRPSQHERFRLRSKLVALEPIARNVAIRRSNPENRWILSTNTDMVFVPRGNRSLSEIVGELPDAYYGLPRFEVPETLWESADRHDPVGTIAAFEEWGRKFHLNEIVFTSHEAVRYDAPGDFQLMLRSDLFRMHGFHEDMLLGWHVDSNMAKRLALLPRPMGDVVQDVFGYHCDHTRQVTPAHRPNSVANDLQEFFLDVTIPEIPKQAETWGLAGEDVEELQVNATAGKYLDALQHAITVPLDQPSQIAYTGENFNRIDYTVEHLIPFLADSVASYRRDTILGWLGAKRGLLSRFAQGWRTIGFSEPIRVLKAGEWLGPQLPESCVWADEATFAAECDVFVFDWGRPDGAEGHPKWDFDTDRTIRAVTRNFRTMVKLERFRLSEPSARPRRFIGVNAMMNSIENLFIENVGAARTPLATRIRQGFVGEQWTARELLSVIHVGNCGRRVRESIRALPGIQGHVSYGPYLDLGGVGYRLTLEFEDLKTQESEIAYSGIGLDFVSGAWLFGYRAISLEDLRRGSLSIEFSIPPAISDGPDSPRIEFRIRTIGRTEFTLKRAYLEETSVPQEELQVAVSDCVPLLTIGPGGEPAPARNAAQSYIIRSRAGVADFVAYGPYFWLPQGRYEATFELDVAQAVEGSTIRLYVGAHLGKTILASGKAHPRAAGSVTSVLTFDVRTDPPPHDDGRLEFMVWSAGQIEFCLVDLQIRKIGESPAVEPLPAVTGYVMPLLATGGAGARLSDALIALPGTCDFVFFGPFLELAPGAYRLSLGFEPMPTRRSSNRESGFALEIMHGERLLAYYEPTRDDVARGALSLDFDVPATVERGLKAEFRLWTNGLMEAGICAATLEPLGAPRAAALMAFDCLTVLQLGPAGFRAPALAGQKRTAIHARPGIAENLTHGPYLGLPPGLYEVTFEFYVERGVKAAAIEADVVSHNGSHCLTKATFGPERRGRLRRMLGDRWGRVEGVLGFEVSDDAPLEFRVWSTGTFAFFLTSTRVKQLAAPPQVAEETAVLP